MSLSVNKPVNFEPDATKIPEYYKNVCLEELKCRNYQINNNEPYK